MKTRHSLLLIFILFSLSSCEIFILAAFEETAEDEMYDYIRSVETWKIQSVNYYTAERGHQNDNFIVSTDSTWSPGGSMSFGKKGRKDDDLYHPMVYTDGNGNTKDVRFELYDALAADNNSRMYFHEWDDFPFPYGEDGFTLEIWGNGKLTIISKEDHTYNQEFLTIEMVE